jgi:hypothetical protein
MDQVWLEEPPCCIFDIIILEQLPLIFVGLCPKHHCFLNEDSSFSPKKK